MGKPMPGKLTDMTGWRLNAESGTPGTPGANIERDMVRNRSIKLIDRGPEEVGRDSDGGAEETCEGR